MDMLATAVLSYVAVGAALFAHPRAPTTPYDFDWRRQIGVFRTTFPSVLLWPLALWCFACAALYRD